MGKMKNKKPDSWKPSPSPTIQQDGFVSKNKKRKAKRMQEKVLTKQAETGDFIPVKKNALTSLQVSGLTGKKQLSTSLPIKSGKKEKRVNPNNSMATLAAPASVEKSKKVTGILSNPNTPKRNKNERVTFALDKKRANAKKFLDDEAEEGEEPIVDKVVKPYEKKGVNKKPQVESSDEGESEDDESVDAEGFFDMEASEGEETDDEDDDDNTDADDSDESDDFSDENTYLSSFLNDDDDENDSDEDEDDEDDSDEDENSEPAPKVKLVHKEKKNEIPTPSKSKKSVDLPAEPTTPAKKNVKADQKKKQKKSDDNVEEVKTVNGKTEEKIDKSKDFIGFIRRLPNTVTEKEIRSALARSIEKGDVLKIMFAKTRKDGTMQNAFVYMKDAKALGNVMHEKFDIAGSLFAVYRARSSAAEESPSTPPEPVAFLPRVPQWITEDELKNAVEKEIGAGKVTKVQDKKFIKALQTRNVLMTFVDADALKEAIYKSDFKIKNHTVIVREAMEGVQVPVYRAVFANIPEGTNEATLKKAVEGSIGKNTVGSVRFSFRKNSYAFVVLKDEETMKKTLALGDSLSLKGTKLQVQPYTPRKPRKRAPPNENAKAKRAAKRKRKSQNTKDEQKGSAVESQQQPSPKKQKLEHPSSDSSSVPPNPKNSPNKQKKQKNKAKKSNVASPSTGEVKAKKNPKMKQKKPAFAASPAKDAKVSPLKNKIQAKKEKFKGQKMQQQKNKNKSKQST